MTSACRAPPPFVNRRHPRRLRCDCLTRSRSGSHRLSVSTASDNQQRWSSATFPSIVSAAWAVCRGSSAGCFRWLRLLSSPSVWPLVSSARSSSPEPASRHQRWRSLHRHRSVCSICARVCRCCCSQLADRFRMDLCECSGRQLIGRVAVADQISQQNRRSGSRRLSFRAH